MAILSADFGGRRTRRRVVRWMVVVALALVFLVFLPQLLVLYTEWLWFKYDVRFPQVFWTILSTKVGLGVVFGAAFLALVLGNVELARRLARRTLWYEEERALRQQFAEVMEYLVGRYLYLGLVVLAVLVAALVGVAAAQEWNTYLLFRTGVPFGYKDPLFQQDVGFYVFRLPFLEYIWRWLYQVLIAVFVLTAATHYFDKAIRVLRGIPAFAPHVKVHLSVLLGLILAAKAIGYRIAAFHLLYSPRGAAFGASYTDATAQLLACNVLLVIALACAALVLVNIHFRGLWLPIAGIGFLAVTSLLLGTIYPALVQRIQVQPNEFAREEPYIRRAIEFTRRGFDLEKMQTRELLAMELVSGKAVRRNIATVENARLWDYRPLLETYRRQQELQPYYTFASVDIDRYVVNGHYRQVTLAARELRTEGIPDQSWQNRHIFYTHGFGIVMSPVTDVIQSGLPELVIRDIPPRSSCELVVKEPRIYYGELTNEYVIVGTSMMENDYPLPATNRTAQTRYRGRGGVPIGSPLPRLAAAVRLNDINILISGAITRDSRVLFGRNVATRAHHIAPFLSYDRDPYIVLGEDGRLYWIQDAYTLSDMFPYSEPVQTQRGRFNYVRNSVKVVTDAYHGSVTYYVADPKDPIIRAYQRAFPGMFRPLTELPAGLGKHLRYPEALFNTQSERLIVYHMTDPRGFYNRVEKWEIARETPKSVGRAEGEETMQAYYAIVHLPGKPAPEYLLMLPFTPAGKPNMVAWLAGLCDGDAYGRLLTYYFPKTEQVWGPMQIEASIDQHPEISGKITLWNREGSQVVRGNLLVLPLDNSVLYVEPLYLRATQNAIPELKQVIVGRGDGRVVMRATLSQALEALLGEPVPRLAAKEPAPEPGEGALAARRGETRAAPETPQAAPGALGPPASDVGVLARRADQQFRRALDRQRQGDWAGYGEALKQLEQTLKELQQAAER